MAIKVTKRHTGERGCTYSISGLTFDQVFRIKNAMYAEAEKMKAIAEGEMQDYARLQEEFKQYAKDALSVAEAVNLGI